MSRDAFFKFYALVDFCASGEVFVIICNSRVVGFSNGCSIF